MKEIRMMGIWLALGDKGAIPDHPNDHALVYSKSGEGNQGGGYDVLGFIPHENYETVAEICEQFNDMKNKRRR